MNSLINILTNFGLLKEDLDYHLVHASTVIIFLFSSCCVLLFAEAECNESVTRGCAPSIRSVGAAFGRQRERGAA
jgi:hypothetical protein